jgi:hypothetical protein
MVHVPGRKAFTGPALIRLLARLTDAGIPDSEPSLADRLCQWLRWTDAIALSAALGGAASAPVSAAASGDAAPDQAPDALCQRVRTSLTNAIARHATLIPHRQQRGHARAHREFPAVAGIAPDYSAFRLCYLSLQEEMETAIGNLRTLLRGMLAARGSAMAQLASMDGVMERVLGVRERNALAAVPGLLAVRFERLREAQIAASAYTDIDTNADPNADVTEPAGPPDAAPRASALSGAAEQSPALADGPWLDAFRKDLQSVLFAELDIRFQPVEGLRAALRDC